MAKISLCPLLAGIALYCAARPAFAATVIVPTDQPTVQGAVNAAGPGGTVIINSNAIFNETVIVTQSLTIHGGVGFTPTIRGSGMCGPTSILSCTLLFTPNSDAAQMLAVSDVRFMPKSGARASGPGVVRILNRGAGEASAIFTNCTIENPEGFGYLAVDVRRISCSAGLNHVSFHGGSINISGVDESFAGSGGFEMAEGGSLEVSNLDLAVSGIDADAFTLFGTPSACGGITFTLNDSNITVGPASPGFNLDIGVLLLDVTANLTRNTFQTISNSEASASGISAGGGSGQQYSGSITLDANHFFGSGPHAGLAVRAAPFANGAIVVTATNNVVHSMQVGFALGQPVGNPAGSLTATLVNNTVDGSLSDAVALTSAAGSTLTVTAENNLLTNSGGWGIAFTAEAGGTATTAGAGTATISADNNGFFNNASGNVDAALAGGTHDVVGDPIYVNYPDDLRLGIGSPMINAGDNAAVSTLKDADGLMRIQNEIVDIGAFEGGFPVIGPTNTLAPTITLTPTATPTLTSTPTPPATATPTRTSNASHTATHTASRSPTAASTSTASPTRTATHTPTSVSSPAMTPTSTSTSPPVLTATRTHAPTGVSTSTVTPTPLVTAAASLTPSLTPVTCVGDCDGSGGVMINELVTMVNVALGTAPATACEAGDLDRDGHLTVNELVRAVNNALDGCP